MRGTAGVADRVLVTGGRGLLGREIAKAFRGRLALRVTDLEECDVTRLEECRREIADFRPGVAIHCAAYTSVDRAEAEPETAHAVNAIGTGNVALACRERGVLLVTFGTDYVFDGAATRPYREEDPDRPLSVYGKQQAGRRGGHPEGGARTPPDPHPMDVRGRREEFHHHDPREGQERGDAPGGH